MKTISAVAALAIVGLVACQDATQPPVDDTSTLAVTASGTKKYWFSDYFPLIPGLYGIKTYEFTVGQTGQFTSQVVGTETVQYSTGAITGTRITFGGGILGGLGLFQFFGVRRGSCRLSGHFKIECHPRLVVNWCIHQDYPTFHSAKFMMG